MVDAATRSSAPSATSAGGITARTDRASPNVTVVLPVNAYEPLRCTATHPSSNHTTDAAECCSTGHFTNFAIGNLLKHVAQDQSAMRIFATAMGRPRQVSERPN